MTPRAASKPEQGGNKFPYPLCSRQLIIIAESFLFRYHHRIKRNVSNKPSEYFCVTGSFMPLPNVTCFLVSWRT